MTRAALAGALALAIAAVAPARAAVRLLSVANGSFEDKGSDGDVPAGWTSSSKEACARDTDRRHGAVALHITCKNASDWLNVSQELKNLPAGESISAACWLKAKNVGKGGQAWELFHLYMSFKTADGKEQKVDIVALDGSADWKWRVKKKIAVPKNLDTAKIVVGFDGVAGEVWVDRVVLAQGDELPPETISTSEEVRTRAEVLKGAIARARTAVRKKSPEATSALALAEAKAGLQAAVLMADDLAREAAEFAGKAPNRGNTATKAALTARAAGDVRTRIATAVRALEEAERAPNEEAAAERPPEALAALPAAETASEEAERRVSDSQLHAATWGGGIYKPASASEWIAANPDAPLPYAAFLAADRDGTVYAGGTDRALFVSADNGKTWGDPPLKLPVVPTGLAFDPADPTHWLVTTWGEGAWLSTDSGRNWTRTPTPTPFLRKLLVVGSGDGQAWYCVADDTRVLRSGRFGGAWTELVRMPRGLKAWDLAVKPSRSAHLLIATDAGVAELQDDGTVTFPKLEVATSFARSLAADLDRVLVGTYGGGIVEWRPEAPAAPRARAINGGLANRNVLALAVSVHPKAEAAGAEAAAGPPVWTDRNAGLTSLRLNGIAVNPKNEKVLFASTQGGMFKSKDVGKFWETASTGLSALNVGRLAVDPWNPDVVYAAPAYINIPSGIQKTSDGAKTWTAKNKGLDPLTAMWIELDRSNPATAYTIVWGGGIYRTYNGGDDWEKASDGLPGLNGYCVVHGEADPKVWLAGLDGSGLYRLDEGADRWVESKKGLTASSIWHLAQDPNDGNAWLAGAPEAGLFKSTDGAKSWRKVTKGLMVSDIYRVVYHPKKPGVVYLGSKSAAGNGPGGGVFRSTDGGESWAPDNAGLPSLNVQDLAVTSTGLIYVGTDSGLFYKQD